MSLQNLFMVFHNSHSRNAVKYFADTCIGLGCRNIIYSKLSSAAASIGIPEAQKTIFKSGGNLLFFSDIPDIIEIFNPNLIFFLVPQKFANEPVPYDNIAKELQHDKKILIIIGGTTPGVTRKELDLGKGVFLEEVISDVNPITQTALFLSGIKKAIQENE